MIKIFFICSLQLPDIPITAGMVSCSVEESADDGKLNEKRKDDIFKKKTRQRVLEYKVWVFDNLNIMIYSIVNPL